MSVSDSSVSCGVLQIYVLDTLTLKTLDMIEDYEFEEQYVTLDLGDVEPQLRVPSSTTQLMASSSFLTTEVVHS